MEMEKKSIISPNIVHLEKGFCIYYFAYDARSGRNAVANIIIQVSWTPLCLIIEIKRIVFLGCFPREAIFILNIFFTMRQDGTKGWTDV
jgi:hypothetical protein